MRLANFHRVQTVLMRRSMHVFMTYTETLDNVHQCDTESCGCMQVSSPQAMMQAQHTLSHIPSPGNDDIGMFSARRNILIKSWLDLLGILVNDTSHIPPSDSNITLYPTEHRLENAPLSISAG